MPPRRSLLSKYFNSNSVKTSIASAIINCLPVLIRTSAKMAYSGGNPMDVEDGGEEQMYQEALYPDSEEDEMDDVEDQDVVMVREDEVVPA